ncbi:Tox-REase-5 domain-containing protein [Yoonia sp. 2307UL14-13]|uniref:Tox-REase-5 domain-containing protein n=1 Tax=Yoonia sp. 2307UL14-13 TaxID=3126506 RepID=UPI00309F3B22
MNKGCLYYAPPTPEDIDLPEIPIPGFPPGEVDEPNITNDPEEGITVGPVIPGETGTAPQAAPEPGSLAGELDGPMPQPDLPQPHPEVKQEIDRWADEDDCTEGCDECAPRVQGNTGWTRYAPEDAEYVGEGVWNGYHYQHDICRLPYEPATSRIQEWKFASYSWDGFEPGSCTMLETKYGYDSRLTHRYDGVLREDGTESVRYRTVPMDGWEGLARYIFRRLIKQAGQQIERLQPYPEAGLLWSFSALIVSFTSTN